MDPTSLLDLILGNLGTLVLLAVLVYALVKEILVPGTYYKAALASADVLRAENTTLNDNYITLLKQNGQMEGRIASLESHVESLKTEIAGLRKQTDSEH